MGNLLVGWAAISVSWAYRKIVPIVDSIFHPQSKATVQQILQGADAVRGGLEESHNGGWVRSVEEDYGYEEHKQDNSGGYAFCL
jgi:hypothetical protein